MQLLQAICAGNEKLAHPANETHTHPANETHAHPALNAPLPEKLTARGGGGGLGWRAGEADNHGTTPLDEAAHITADGRRPDVYLLILKYSGLADLTLVSRRKFATQRQKRQQNSSRSDPPPRTRLSVRLEMLHSHSLTLTHTEKHTVACCQLFPLHFFPFPLALLVSPWRHPDTAPMSHPACTLVSTDGSRQTNVNRVKVTTYPRRQVQRTTPPVACVARVPTVPCQSPCDTRHFSSSCDIPLHLHPAHMLQCSL
jgi:hypothetical protein